VTGATKPAGGIRSSFQRLAESVRRSRNRIGHYRAVLDEGPTNHHADALDPIRWCRPTIARWASTVSRVAAVVIGRPAAGAGSEGAGPHARIPTVTEDVRGAADAPPPAGMPVAPRQRTPPVRPDPAA